MQINMDFSQHVKEVLNRNNIQISSLKFLDSDTKNKFFVQRKKAILLIRNKVYEREITPLKGGLTLDISDTQLIPYLKKEQPVIVVLPTGGKKRYILQTKVINIFIDRFQITILDPRKAKRFSFSSSIMAKIRPVCDATSIRLQNGELRVIRYIDESLQEEPLSPARQTGTNPAEGAEKNNPGPATGQDVPPYQGPHFSLKDMMFKDEGNDLADDFIRLEKQKPIAGTILDISCGGMCATYQPGAADGFFVDQLVAIECSFANGSTPNAGSGEIKIFVFAAVRNLKNNQGAHQLNMRFLASLPNKIEPYWQEENHQERDENKT